MFPLPVTSMSLRLSSPTLIIHPWSVHASRSRQSIHPSSSFVCSGNLNTTRNQSQLVIFKTWILTRDTEVVCNFVFMIIEKISYLSFSKLCDNTFLNFCYCKVFNSGKELCRWWYWWVGVLHCSHVQANLSIFCLFDLLLFL